MRIVYGALVGAAPLNEKTLLALLAEGAERDDLDYKQTCDLNNTRDRVNIAKHIGAMQMMGGVIVIGADDQGSPTGQLDANAAKLFDLATLKSKVDRYLPAGTRLSSSYVESGGRHFALVRVGPHAEVIAPFESDGVYRDANGADQVAFRKGDIFVRDGSRSRLADLAAIQAARSRIVEQAREEARSDFEQAVATLTEKVGTEAVRGHLVGSIDRKELTEALLAELRTQLASPVSAKTYLRILADGEALQLEAETAGKSHYRPLHNEELPGPALDDYRRRESQWLDDCERALGPSAFAAVAAARGLPNTDYFAISTRMSARLDVLRQLSEELVEPGLDSTTLVRRALNEGQELRPMVLREDGQHRIRALNEDALFIWAKKTWRMLAGHVPEHADEFYGEDPELGGGYFALSFMIDSKQSRSDYLESRLAMLRRLAERGA